MNVRKFVLEYLQAYGSDHSLGRLPANRRPMVRIPGLGSDESLYTIPDNEFVLWVFEALLDIDKRVKELEKEPVK